MNDEGNNVVDSREISKSVGSGLAHLSPDSRGDGTRAIRTLLDGAIPRLKRVCDSTKALKKTRKIVL